MRDVVSRVRDRWLVPCLGIALVLSGISMVATADPELPEDPVAEALTEAAASGEIVEISELTDENSLSVANPDGTVTVTLDREAVRVRDGGEFVPVDTSLVVTPFDRWI